jgi:hypothetical protein
MSANRSAFLKLFSITHLDPPEFIDPTLFGLEKRTTDIKKEIEELEPKYQTKSIQYGWQNEEAQALLEKIGEKKMDLEETENLIRSIIKLGRAAIHFDDAIRLLEVCDSLLKDDKFIFYNMIRDCYNYVILKLGNKDQIDQALLRLATMYMEGLLVVNGSKLETKYERMSLPDTETVTIADQIAELVDDKRLYNDWYYTVREKYISEKKIFCDFLQKNYVKK